MNTETKIKLCGLKSEDDIKVANSIVPDYIGFVFALKKREVDEETALSLSKLVDERILKVGVFLNDSIERIIRICKAGTIDLVQLHGSESDEYIEEIQKKTGKRVIKAFKVNDSMDLKCLENSKADYILVDAGYGDGKTFDWSLIRELKRPFFLAGGLTPENIPDAIKTCRPYCIDISSGIEFPGEYKKDPEKMCKAANACRNIK